MDDDYLDRLRRRVGDLEAEARELRRELELHDLVRLGDDIERAVDDANYPPDRDPRYSAGWPENVRYSHDEDAADGPGWSVRDSQPAAGDVDGHAPGDPPAGR